LCYDNPYVGSLSSSLPEIASKAEEWLSHLEDHLVTAGKAEIQQHNHNRFFPFTPSSSCTFSCIGGECSADESKIICGMEYLQHAVKETEEHGNCIVYSLGGNNLWSFENDILSKTSCQVHTFDCTGPASRFQKPQDDRLTFHHLCLGAVSSPAPTMAEEDCASTDICGPIMTLSEIQARLGHNQVDLLKMDIEGFEWPIFDSWPELTGVSTSDFVYPMQITVEIHYQTRFLSLKSPEDIVRLQAHLLRLGYAVMVRDDNPYCVECTELTLIRFRC
jgi:hypothetical protein